MSTPYPKHLMIEITDRCNLKCMICVREEYEEGIGGPGVLMDVDGVKKLELPIRHAEMITVTGFGESFLHPGLKEILDYIYLVNPADNLIKVVTNGTALSASKASWFSGHLHTMSISLNASNAEAYAREMYPYEYRDGKDMTAKFDSLVNKILAFSDTLKQEERAKVHLHYVVHSDNVREMANFVRLAHEMRLSTVWFTHLMVHRAEHIGRSIFWIKDEYNDAGFWDGDIRQNHKTLFDMKHVEMAIDLSTTKSFTIDAKVTLEVLVEELRVIPFETAARFPDIVDPAELARALNVDAVLTGSLQSDGDRLLVTVSLVEGASGFISWTDEFEETFDNLFDMQTRIAQGVAARLGQELTGEAEATLALAESSSVDAYDLYLQGAEFVLDGDQESTEIGYQLFSRAVIDSRSPASLLAGEPSTFVLARQAGKGR